MLLIRHWPAEVCEKVNHSSLDLWEYFVYPWADGMQVPYYEKLGIKASVGSLVTKK